MNFNLFTQRISKIENLPLPGEEAHFLMAPEGRVAELRNSKFDRNAAKKAGVMALFYPDAHDLTHLLLILRKTYKGVHSNQIAFPGGKFEAIDVDLKATALRETWEEVGVPVSEIEVLKQLSAVYIPPSNFEVYPFLGLYKNPLPFIKQDEEVAALVEVSLVDFMDDRNLFEQNLSTSYAKDILVPAFSLNGYTVWGATAMMLSEVKALLRQVL